MMHRGRDVSSQDFEIGHVEIIGPVADLGPYHHPLGEVAPGLSPNTNLFSWEIPFSLGYGSRISPTNYNYKSRLFTLNFQGQRREMRLAIECDILLV